MASSASWVTWASLVGSRAGVVENNPHVGDIKLVHTNYLPTTSHTVRAKCELGTSSLVSPDIVINVSLLCTDSLPEHVDAVEQNSYEIVHA